MADLTTTQLADKLGVTKGRISQLVSGGKLDGCYTGEGRNRRFDLAACAKALNRRLDPGQMMGNGAGTRRRLQDIEQGAGDGARDSTPDRAAPPAETGRLTGNDPDRYELARTLKAEEEARKLRRQNALEDRTLVLADEAALAARRALAAEVAQFENVIRQGARAVADRLGVDFKTARQILIETWREHRAARAGQLGAQAEAAQMTETERDADF